MPEQIFPAAPLTTAAGRVISSPFQFVTTGEDNLRIVAVNILAGVRVAIQGRRLSSKGEIEAFAFTHTPNTDRTVTTQDYPLGVGAILNLTIFATGATPVIGMTFVQAKLIRGLGGATIVLGTLLQGYITSAQELAWPGSPIVSSIDVAGYYRTIVGTQPAAGSEIAETVPTGARWQVLTVALVLTTSAVAGNRRVILQLDTGGIVLFRSASPAVQLANTSEYHLYAVGAPYEVALTVNANVNGLPTEPQLLTGQRMITFTEGLLGGDQFGAPAYTVREWLEVA